MKLTLEQRVTLEEARRIVREKLADLPRHKELTNEQRRAVDRMCDIRNGITELLMLADTAAQG